MSLHMVKLCVGVGSPQELRDRITRLGRGGPVRPVSISTRSTPARASELLEGGSLYWVMKGRIACRQPILEITSETHQCVIVLGPDVVDVSPRPKRPFQGWRYLEPTDAPPDLGGEAEALAEMPEAMRRELSELGLL